MTELAVITPSYAPDFELCRDLSKSVLRQTPACVRHYIFTPKRDLARFSELRGPRTHVLPVDELLPASVLSLPRLNFWLNLRRPFPPVRGWVLQQVIKLAAAARIEASSLLLADSDTLLVRPVDASTFRRAGRPLFYRKHLGVTASLPRHVTWHQVARTLLGVPPRDPPLPDYISAFNVWDRGTVLALLDRIERTAGRPWLDAVTAQLHISEFILYGVFVDEVLGASAQVAPSGSMLCHSYWDPSPLSAAQAAGFAAALPDSDVAIMISAKSGTPLDVRRAALARFC